MDEIAKAMLDSGKSFNYYNIQHIENFNPNATQVTTNYYGDQFVPKGQVRKEVSSPESETQLATRNPQLIIDYVMRLHPMHVRQEWIEKYQALWEEILELPVVVSRIYDKGRQQGTTFNRNLVANILHLMAEKKVLVTDNATKLAMTLEGTSDTSVRAQLGVMPPKEIESSVGKMIVKS